MYSRNTKGRADGYEYPFTLPERYGGSRFRPVREPSTHVHTEQSAPLTRMHGQRTNSPPASTASLPSSEPILLTDTFTEIVCEEPPTEGAPDTAEQVVSDTANTVRDEVPSHTPSPFFGISGEDLLLAGLILLLTREGENSGDLAALLALLFAYRGSAESK